MAEQILQNLLSQISLINNKYKEIAEITGENFNVFKILKVEANEVGTHSAFLCELLNPQGTHGCKDVFLKLFLEQQRIRNKEHEIFIDRFHDFNTINCIVIPESHIGFKNEDESEGGRIDILLKDKTGKAIIIENKIYAVDQPKQLVRYNNAYKEAPIFYLTLYGMKPSENSKGDLNEGDSYICISYKEDILGWLDICRKEAANYPIIRETITQYINLIKLLTGQTLNKNMKDDIVATIISNQYNIEIAFRISDSIQAIKDRLIEKFFNDFKEIANEISLENDFLKIEFQKEDVFDENREFNFWFIVEGWKSYCINFSFENNYADDFSCSIGQISNDAVKDISKDDPRLKKISETLNEICMGENRGIHAPWLSYFEGDYSNWKNKPESWMKIANGEMKSFVKQRTKEIIEKINKSGIEL